MKLFPALTPFLLATCVLGRDRSSIDTLHSKFRQAAPLSLNDASFSTLTSGPRNHTLVVTLTALQARYGCQVCKEFQPEWDLVAKSWAKADLQSTTKIIFGTLDFDDGKAAFQKLMLQTAPVLLIYPSTASSSVAQDQPLRFDFLAGSQSAEQVQAWIVGRLRVSDPPTIRRPINYMRLIVIAVVLLGIISTLSVAHSIIMPVFQSKAIWAGISLLTILLFISGHMFNHIRKVPYIAGNDKGSITYIAGGFSNQLGMESQIVAALYGVLSLASVILATKVSSITNARTQQGAVIFSAVTLFGVYAFFLSVFRIKNGGYPFYLPPF